MFFAFEDRELIIKLFVETFGRLTATLKVSHDQLFKTWEKVDAIMTDVVTKNLQIEETIAKVLGSSQIPLH